MKRIRAPCLAADARAGQRSGAARWKHGHCQVGHAQVLGRGAQESARLPTRRSALPSPDRYGRCKAGHAQLLGRRAQESARLLTRRSALPSLDLDSVVSLARADSAISTGICLAKTKSQALRLQRCSEGACPLDQLLPVSLH